MMESYLLFPTLLVLSLIWLYFHTASKKEKSVSAKKSQQHTHAKYHGVTIDICTHACENVLPLENKRFLANDVTSLPVAGCTNRQCNCKYHHHQDRRSGEDRRYPSIAMQHVFSSTEQRIRHGRRREDFA